MTKNTTILIDGQYLSLWSSDTHLFDPDTTPVLDYTGQPLKVGTKVAWGTSYRGGGGAVIGEITHIGHKRVGYSVYALNEDGSHVYEEYDYMSYDHATRRFDKPTKGKRLKTVERERWSFSVETKSLMKNRKGNTFSDANDVVAIANQDFAG